MTTKTKLKIPVVQTWAIVIPVYDLFGVDDMVPTSRQFSVGYCVGFWNPTAQCFEKSGDFELEKDAIKAAQQYHDECIEKYDLKE